MSNLLALEVWADVDIKLALLPLALLPLELLALAAGAAKDTVASANNPSIDTFLETLSINSIILTVKLEF